jgi:uncharacterized protein (TIGR04222 family)
MEWLTDNYITNLHGADFLSFYACVIVASLGLLVLARIWTVYNNTPVSANPLPSRPDPKEIAYLRGGPSAVVPVVVLGLLNDGCLHKHADRYRISPRAPPHARAHSSASSVR